MATKFATDYPGLEVSYRSKDIPSSKSDQREHTPAILKARRPINRSLRGALEREELADGGG